ncbi:MAG: pilus assembly protein PilZ [Treponema sp.]|jgi:hypothetical protein|nr:pilus assembly protein PilZ [Treponema sp.]
MSDAARPGSGEEADRGLGKKVFFLYPSAMVKNAVIQELMQQEYEVYTVKDPAAMLRGLKRYPDSVVFVNINEGLDAARWEEWIRSVRESAKTAQACIGVLSNTDDALLRGTYLTGIGVQCGFTVLKSDAAAALRQILENLRKVEAKGRRRYLRAGRGIGASINLPIDNVFINGQIRDISAVGFSCVLDQNPNLARNVLIQNIQLKILGRILKVEGIVYGSRDEEDGSRCYVLLFTQRVDSDTRSRIRGGIQQYLQSSMDRELK